MLTKSDGVVEMQAAQGWTDETLLALALQFLDQNGLTERFESYLGQVADQENVESGRR
jgi:hypothetical protein